MDPTIVERTMLANAVLAKGFGANRTESHQRPHLKQLVISRRPVVQQHEAEDMLLCVLYRHPLAPWHRLGDEVTHLELKVKTPCWTVSRVRIDAIREVDVRRPRDGAGRGQHG